MIFRELRRRLAGWLLGVNVGEQKMASSSLATTDGTGKGLSDNENGREVQGLSLEPYERALLQRARDYWLNSNWTALTAMSDEEIQHHPDRAKLALLVGAAQTQLGQLEDAKTFLVLAQKWGCTKKQVAQILLAGVHQCMGRAEYLLGSEEGRKNALMHFEKSVNTAGLKGVANLQEIVNFQIETQQQKIQLGIESAPKKLVPGAEILKVSSVIQQWVQKCISAKDLHGTVDSLRHDHLPKWEQIDQFTFYVALADAIVAGKGDKLAAFSYLQSAKKMPIVFSPTAAASLITRFIAMGYIHQATEFFTDLAVKGIGPLPISAKDRAAIEKANSSMHQSASKESEHGHDLLLSGLNKNISEYKKLISPRKPTLVEIGTTREEIPGQGSTRKIALFCKQNDIEFITVDMDPHNSLLAQEMFNDLGVSNFKAIAAKGEDYLRDYDGSLDFVFLDAYDFDHGKHSELRQSRYEQFLGSRIDELKCHQMHLDCAESVVSKLAPDGLVCVDDTWLDDGKWTAKGTLAVPYLLGNNFELVEARNKAALLRRKKSSAENHG